MPSCIPATHHQLLGDAHLCVCVSASLFPIPVCSFCEPGHVGHSTQESRDNFQESLPLHSGRVFLFACILFFCNFRTTEYSSLAGPRVSRLSSCVHLPPSCRDVEIDRGLQPRSSFSCSFWGLNSGHQAVQQTLFHPLNPSVGCLSFFLFQSH